MVSLSTFLCWSTSRGCLCQLALFCAFQSCNYFHWSQGKRAGSQYLRGIYGAGALGSVGGNSKTWPSGQPLRETQPQTPASPHLSFLKYAQSWRCHCLQKRLILSSDGGMAGPWILISSPNLFISIFIGQTFNIWAQDRKIHKHSSAGVFEECGHVVLKLLQAKQPPLCVYGVMAFQPH